MTPRPQLKPWIRVGLLPGEGIILLSDRGALSFNGKIYPYLVPMLNGTLAVEEIILRGQDQFSAEEVFLAIMNLRGKECLIDSPLGIPPEQAALWDLSGIRAEDVTKQLQKTRVSIVSCGEIDSTPLQEALTALGVDVDGNGQYQVVLTEDYLHTDLESLNREALVHNRPWCLVNPLGAELWLGPVFLPGQTACWDCLAQRLHGSRKVENYLRERLGFFSFFRGQRAFLPSTVLTAMFLAATEIARWIVCGRSENLEGCLLTLDALSLERRKHVVTRRPQCPACGDPAAFAAGQTMPILLQSRKKTFTTDGGHRICSPEETLRKLERYISPLTGIVSFLQPTADATSEETLSLSYVTGHNFMHAVKDYASGFEFLHSALRDGSSGKGRMPAQAQASALCEAIERYSGVFQGDEARFPARLKDLGAAAIPPNACMLFSQKQIQSRNSFNMIGAPSNWAPEPFDDSQEIEWSPVWSLTHKVHRYIPTAYCYYGYSRRNNTWFARADSNGCAAGHCKEEAIFQGFLELVERDSVSLWWYNRLQRPAVDLPSFSDPYFQELQDYYGALLRELWVLDITSDLAIPTFAAISRRTDSSVEDIILGLGTHFDVRIALLRALTELNQLLPVVAACSSSANRYPLFPDPEAALWWQTATLANQPYLEADQGAVPKRRVDYAYYERDDLADDVSACVQIAAEKGLETLVLDQTRPDAGLHVVKVIVPGLRHFWPRFAPGRLYDVPVQMSWRTHPLVEEQLNPHPFYL